jgi:DNA-binding CsgD family transcriptional regulator/tetratricopeptide (TPR) repeat protein
MLQTLRAYGLARLGEAGEERDVLAALAAFAWSVAGQTAAELEASGDRELDAMRWLDAEDATLSRAVDWALDHAPDDALRLAVALAPWLRRRGRLAKTHEWLRTALARSSSGDQSWTRAQLGLGLVLSSSTDLTGAIDSYMAAIEGYRHREPSRELVAALVALTVARLNIGEDPATVDDARHALAVARELGDPASERHALTALSLTAYYAADAAGGLDWAEAQDWARQAAELLPFDGPAYHARWDHYILATVLAETRALGPARSVSEAGLTLSRQAGDLVNLVGLLFVMAILERLAGNLAEARAHLAEGTEIASRNGDHVNLTNLIEECGCLCAETGRWADAVTLWAAHTADRERRGLPEGTVNRSRLEHMGRIERVLEPGQLREAQARGTLMTIPAAAELVILITTATATCEKTAGPVPGRGLSPRERELVTLVAQGHTNAEIAGRLYISVRTVASHLDRIRDKTGYRRRADLTRLAIEESLV